ARIEVPGETAWWVQRAYGSTGRLEDGVFVTEYSSLAQLASWVLRQDGRAVPLEPDELRREVASALRRVRDGHEGQAPEPPLEARAIRLALEYVGPMIAADAHSPLDKVRRKLEETFGQFELSQAPEPAIERAEEDLIGTLARGRDERRLVEIEYQKEVDAQP